MVFLKLSFVTNRMMLIGCVAVQSPFVHLEPVGITCTHVLCIVKLCSLCFLAYHFNDDFAQGNVNSQDALDTYQQFLQF